MKIGIAGAGGIGSNVAFHLVRSGVLDLKVFDFDRIEASNLNRQFYFADQIGSPKVAALKTNLLRIDPAASIEAIVQRLDADNMPSAFADCDIVVEAFDRAETKAMLINALADSGKYLVSGSGLAGLSPEGVKLRKLGEDMAIAGDFSSDVARYRLYSPKVMLVASLMAIAVLQKLGYSEQYNAA
ncbi:MAG: sulfur carrier protein ThiS adenylyltransferase ThiF [Proteobacteria bacterium]|nr:sulfur carrier protein ThiS adenylyltransferase ThiF [Pseudomonadota bacterium]